MSEAFDLQLRTALVGNFDAEIEAAKHKHYSCARRAVFQTATEYQGKFRADMAQSGLRNAERLTKTWRVKFYRSTTGNDAAFVYSNAPNIIAAFEADSVIKSKDGWFLLVPNPQVWKGGRISRRGRRGSTQSTLQLAEAKFGPLHYVYVSSKLSFLVADVRASTTQAGTFRRVSAKAQSSGRGMASIIVFFLLPQVHMRKRLHSAELRRRAERDGNSRIEQLYVQFFNEGGNEPPKVIAL